MKKENFSIDFEKPITFNNDPSDVFKAIDKSSKIEYAIKKIPKLKNISEHIEILEYLNNCENSIKYYGSFDDEDSNYIVMELCEYSIAKKLNDKMKEGENLSIKEIKEIFLDVNKVLIKMREKNIIHGNLKPENILAKTINNKLLYKLTDYGSFNKLDLKYQAPEYNDPKIKDKSKIDLWSIGMILYELHFGSLPQTPINKKKLLKSDNNFFDDLIRKLLVANPFEIKDEIKSEKNEEEEEEDDNDDEDSKIKKTKDVRITWEEYFDHEFFKNDYLKEMKILKKSFNGFKNEVRKLISFINEKYKQFKNSIIKEEEEFCSDENNEKIKNLSRLLREYKFENDKESVIKFFNLTQYSIMKDNFSNEYVEFSNTELITYHGEVIKGTKIKNGKGKEYYLNGELCYEGEYINDKRDGKGKQYSEEGEIIFIGEFKEGEQWEGIRKIFEEYEDENEQVIKYMKYIAQIRRGIPIGKCKEFDIEGNLVYIGDFSEGKRNGIGKEIFNDKVSFEGEFKDGIKWNGNANEYNKKGNLLFYGVYQNGKKFSGKECKYFEDDETIKYEIEYKDGLYWNAKGYNKKDSFSNIDFEMKNGNGVMKEYYSDTVLKSTCNYKGGKKNGKVVSYYNNKNHSIKYEGEYIDNIKNGEWKTYYENGKEKYVENYKNGAINGKCKEYNESGKLVFEGEYKKGIKWNGKERIIYDCNQNLEKKIVIERKYSKGKALSVEYYEHKKFSPQSLDLKGLEFIQGLINQGHDKNDFSEEINYESYITNLLFIGEHTDDQLIKEKINRNGKGTEYHENKKAFSGEYKDGKRINGKGKLYDYNGNLIFDGDYINGKRNGKVIEYYEDIEGNPEQDSNLLVKYEGRYIDDQKNGEGKEFQYDEENNAEIVFEGVYKNGEKWNGVGKEYYAMPDKLLFSGEYREGKRWNGNFCEYSNVMDRIKLKGKYVNGEKVEVKKNEEFIKLYLE